VPPVFEESAGPGYACSFSRLIACPGDEGGNEAAQRRKREREAQTEGDRDICGRTDAVCRVDTAEWLPGVAAKSIPIAAASPWESGYIESFDSRLRDEFLESVEFEGVKDAQAKGSWFRREYNAVRLRSSLEHATPREFSAACDETGTDQRDVK